jgi:hypothetical protein
MTSGVYMPLPSPRRAAGAGALGPAPILASRARVLAPAETRVPRLEAVATIIKVPPLRVRPADVGPLAKLFLREIARDAGTAPIALTAAALRQLEAHTFPDNVAELKAAVARAAAASGAPGGAGAAATGPRRRAAAAAGPGSAKWAAARPSSTGPVMTLASIDTADPGLQITSDALWFAAGAGDRLRASLLAAAPRVRDFLRGDFWWENFTLKLVAPVYFAYCAYLFLGPQDRAHNFGLNLFWAWWWPGIFIVYPFLGRIWCGFCPFMAWGELVSAREGLLCAGAARAARTHHPFPPSRQTQRARMALLPNVPLKKWPRDTAEK